MPGIDNKALDNAPSYPLAAVPGRAMTLEDWELHGIKASLRECAGNISLAAKNLGITRTTLYRKIERFGLDKIDWREHSKAG
jgi:transcriptional regulator of acetoin/glycerol metabolism